MVRKCSLKGFKRTQTFGDAIHKNAVPPLRGRGGMRFITLEKIKLGFQVVVPKGTNFYAKKFRSKTIATREYNKIMDCLKERS